MTWIIIKRILFSCFGVFELLIVARAVMSFIAMAVSNSVFHQIYHIIQSLTEPFLKPIRLLLSKVPFLEALPIDFSPVIVLLILSFLSRVIQWL